MRDVDEELAHDEGARRPGAPVDPARLLRVVLPKWKWVVGAGTVGLIVGIVFAKVFVPVYYQSETVVAWQVDRRGRDTAGPAPSTLLESLKLPENLAAIKTRAGTDMSEKAIQRALQASTKKGQDLLLTVTATTVDQELAPKLANTAVDVLDEYYKSRQTQHRQETVDNLQHDIELARERVKKARKAYNEFREEKGVSDVSAESQLAIQTAADLRAQADQARAEAEAEKARARELERMAKQEKTVVVQGEQRTNPAAAELGAVRAELASVQSRLSNDHPKVRALKAKIAALEQRAGSSDSEVRSNVAMGPNSRLETIRATLSNAEAQREAALERRQLYEKFADQAENRLKELSAVEGQAAVLLSDIRIAENHLSQLESKLVDAVDAVRNPGSPLHVLSEAAVPEGPAHSNRKKVILAFPLASVMLAVFMILVSALRGLRVHTATEAGFWGNAPVVASSTWPGEPAALGSLVVELGDYIQLGSGSTLIVGATRRESPLAREIAYWLSALTRQKEQPYTAPSAGSFPAPSGSSEGQLQLPGYHHAALPREGDAARNPSDAPPVSPTPPGVTIQRLAQRDPASRNHTIRQWAVREDETGKVLTQARASNGGALPAHGPRVAKAWEGASSGPELRRAARLADRVLVLLSSDTLSIADVAQLRTRLGRQDGIGLLVVNLDPELAELPDQVGEVSQFWRNARSHVA